jgi:hypothetical protein
VFQCQVIPITRDDDAHIHAVAKRRCSTWGLYVAFGSVMDGNHTADHLRDGTQPFHYLPHLRIAVLVNPIQEVHEVVQDDRASAAPNRLTSASTLRR